MGKGNGDPRLTIFGAEITPNQHALARDFVTLDNFYASGTVSADGQRLAAPHQTSRSAAIGSMLVTRDS